MTDLHIDSKRRRAGILNGPAELPRRKELRSDRRKFRSWPLLPVPVLPPGRIGPALDWPQGQTIEGGDDWQDRPDERDLGHDFSLAPEPSVWHEAKEQLQQATRSRTLKICLLASVALHLGCAVFLITMPSPETVEIAGGGTVSVMLVGEQAFDSLASGKSDGEDVAQPAEETEAAETAEKPVEATTTQEVVDPAPIETTTAEPLDPVAPPTSALTAEPVETVSELAEVAPAVAEAQEAAPAESVAAAQNLAIDPSSASETGELAQAASVEPLPQKQVETPETSPVEPLKVSEPPKPVEKPAEKKAAAKKVEKPKSDEKKVAARKKAETEQEAKRAAAKSRKGESGEADANAQRGSSANSNSHASADPGNAAVSNYPGKVAAKLRRALKYPKSAVSSSRGETQVAFTVLADGSATGIRIVVSSGSPVLDQAAMEAVRRASPFPPIPAEAGRGKWPFAVPVLFTR